MVMQIRKILKIREYMKNSRMFGLYRYFSQESENRGSSLNSSSPVDSNIVLPSLKPSLENSCSPNSQPCSEENSSGANSQHSSQENSSCPSSLPSEKEIACSPNLVLSEEKDPSSGNNCPHSSLPSEEEIACSPNLALSENSIHSKEEISGPDSSLPCSLENCSSPNLAFSSQENSSCPNCLPSSEEISEPDNSLPCSEENSSGPSSEHSSSDISEPDSGLPGEEEKDVQGLPTTLCPDYAQGLVREDNPCPENPRPLDNPLGHKFQSLDQVTMISRTAIVLLPDLRNEKGHWEKNKVLEYILGKCQAYLVSLLAYIQDTGREDPAYALSLKLRVEDQLPSKIVCPRAFQWPNQKTKDYLQQEIFTPWSLALSKYEFYEPMLRDLGNHFDKESLTEWVQKGLIIMARYSGDLFSIRFARASPPWDQWSRELVEALEKYWQHLQGPALTLEVGFVQDKTTQSFWKNLHPPLGSHALDMSDVRELESFLTELKKSRPQRRSPDKDERQDFFPRDPNKQNKKRKTKKK